ncbi:hypothetical protein HYALB_00006808 [Hymenoscyphus albidus]|uniref:Enoyl reductase (ER) domain-containing protein n=1 Tax=Hymenoscyphus albidus TaxID=595503 RepID=A0A9N9Q6J1_9HELO|nr:hypothetical protein HYALB_00006808 [Hymenoscyphus albidus]
MSTPSIPPTVRAIFQPDIQSPSLVLTRLLTQLPQNNTTEHLIKVHAVSPCASELTWAKNYPSLMDSNRVAIPCFDFVGTVILAPPSSPFPPGTEVYTRTPGGRTGNGREYTIAEMEQLARKPKNLTMEEAASVPISAFTAWQALFDHGGLKMGWKDMEGKKENQGKRVLVTAAAGGVGSWAVQLAKLAGVGEIIAVAGSNNVEFVKGLGATEVVDYRKISLGGWAKQNERVDLVIDMVGGQTLTDAWFAVRDGGRILGVNDVPESYFFVMEALGWQLKQITDLIEKGEVHPVVDSIWEFEDFEEAFAKVEGGHARGKVIIRIQ